MGLRRLLQAPHDAALCLLEPVEDGLDLPRIELRERARGDKDNARRTPIQECPKLRVLARERLPQVARRGKDGSRDDNARWKRLWPVEPPDGLDEREGALAANVLAEVLGHVAHALDVEKGQHRKHGEGGAPKVEAKSGGVRRRVHQAEERVDHRERTLGCDRGEGGGGGPRGAEARVGGKPRQAKSERAGGEAAALRAAGGRRGHSRSLLERALRTASAWLTKRSSPIPSLYMEAAQPV